MSDWDLLKSYLCENSQAAFATLVQRYVNLVYSAALRQVRSAALAEEVTQSVFLDLARNAARLRPGQPLVAWLYLVTRRTAVDAIRGEARRQAREQIAAEIAAMKTPSPTWLQARDSLDEAMVALNDTERTVLLLRYFENHSLREVGAALGISEDTAQKRVSRALERLRAVLLRRGVAASAVGLATDLSAHAVEAAPATLGTAISATASGLGLGAAAATSHSAVALAIASKAALVATVAAVLGVVVVQATAIARQRSELAEQPARIEQLHATLRQLRADQQSALRRLQEAQAGLARPAQIRSVTDPEMEKAIDDWLRRVDRLKQLAGKRPDLGIPDLFALTEKDWFVAAKSAQLETEDQIRAAFRGLQKTARTSIARSLDRALHAYAFAHEGELPKTTDDLAPFLDSHLPRTLLATYELRQTGALAAVPADEVLLAEGSALALINDDRVVISTHGHAIEDLNQVSSREFRHAVRAYALGQDGRLPTAAADLTPYLRGHVNSEALKQFLARPADDFTPQALQVLLGTY